MTSVRRTGLGTRLLLLGEARENGDLPEPLPDRARGIAAPARAAGDALADGAAARHLRSHADRHMADDAHLPAQRHEILEHRAAGNADLRDDDAVASHGHVVADLHEIVDLGAFAD